MVGFGKTLLSLEVPEWQDRYLRYDLLKDLIFFISPQDPTLHHDRSPSVVAVGINALPVRDVFAVPIEETTFGVTDSYVKRRERNRAIAHLRETFGPVNPSVTSPGDGGRVEEGLLADEQLGKTPHPPPPESHTPKAELEPHAVLLLPESLNTPSGKKKKNADQSKETEGEEAKGQGKDKDKDKDKDREGKKKKEKEKEGALDSSIVSRTESNKSLKKKEEDKEDAGGLSEQNRAFITSILGPNPTPVAALKMFYSIIAEDMDRADSFYVLQEAKIVNVLSMLHHQIQAMVEARVQLSGGATTGGAGAHIGFLAALFAAKIVKKETALQNAFKALYREIVMTRNFATLCETGFHKILKKLDKHLTLTGQPPTDPRIIAAIDALRLSSSKVLDDGLADLVATYASAWTHADRDLAVSHLSVKITAEEQHRVNLIRLGFVMGAVAIVALQVAWLLAFEFPSNVWHARLAATVFRVTGAVGFTLFGAAVNVYYFRKYKINYANIFEISTKERLHHYQYFELSGYALAMTVMPLFMYTRATIEEADLVANGGDPGNSFWPLFWFSLSPCLIAGWLFLPLKVLFWSTRAFFLRSLFRIVVSPLVRVRFVDFYLADQLTSVGNFFTQVRLAACLTSDPSAKLSSCSFPNDWVLTVFATLPSWWRFLQCCRRFRDSPVKSFHPHLNNAGKYISSIAVSVIVLVEAATRKPGAAHWSNLRVAWLVVNCLSTLYRLAWDMWMDWGLLQWRAASPMLRDKLLYPTQFYYWSLVVNFLLRWIWLIPMFVTVFPLEFINLFVSYLELFRRLWWNLLRVEYEQCSNIMKRAATFDVPLPYKTTTDQKVVISFTKTSSDVANEENVHQ